MGGCVFASADQPPAGPGKAAAQAWAREGSRPTTESGSDCNHKHRFSVALSKRAAKARWARMERVGPLLDPVSLRTPGLSSSILDLRLIVPSGS